MPVAGFLENGCEPAAYKEPFKYLSSNDRPARPLISGGLKDRRRGFRVAE